MTGPKFDSFPQRNDGDDSWFAKAACHGKPTSWFFPTRGDLETAVKGREVCKTCTVRLECLEWAIRNHEREGTWGGMHPKERHALARRRRLGLA